MRLREIFVFAIWDVWVKLSIFHFHLHQRDGRLKSVYRQFCERNQMESLDENDYEVDVLTRPSRWSKPFQHNHTHARLKFAINCEQESKFNYDYASGAACTKQETYFTLVDSPLAVLCRESRKLFANTRSWLHCLSDGSSCWGEANKFLGSRPFFWSLWCWRCDFTDLRELLQVPNALGDCSLSRYFYCMFQSAQLLKDTAIVSHNMYLLVIF